MRATVGSISDELNRMLARVRVLTGSWTGQAASSFDGWYQQMNAGWS